MQKPLTLFGSIPSIPQPSVFHFPSQEEGEQHLGGLFFFFFSRQFYIYIYVSFIIFLKNKMEFFNISNLFNIQIL